MKFLFCLALLLSLGQISVAESSSASKSKVKKYLAATPDSVAEPIDLPSAIANTLSCNKSIQTAASDYSQVYEAQGLHFVRTLSPGEALGKTNFQLTLTDGEQVYLLEVPAEGPGRTNAYIEDYNFKLTLPTKNGAKSFCISHSANVLRSDTVKQFDPSPPKECPYEQKTATVLEGKAGLDGLQRFHRRMWKDLQGNVGIATSVTLHPEYKHSNGAFDTANDLKKKTPKDCDKILSDSYVDQQLKQELANLKTFKESIGATASSLPTAPTNPATTEDHQR